MSNKDELKEELSRMEGEGGGVVQANGKVIARDYEYPVDENGLTDHNLLEPFMSSPNLLPRAAGLPKAPSPRTVYMNVKTGIPYLRQGKPASAFRALRKAVLDGAGFDFLAVAADMMREKGFQSSKVGVANRSRHKCGDAFDFDQSRKELVIVSEPQGIKQYFRTWLRTTKQDGSMGIKVRLKDIRGATVEGYYFDFTDAAERLGWRRIKAWTGWGLKGSAYNKMEFWHYELTEGLSWDEAIAFLYSNIGGTVNDHRKPAPIRILGLNDRGSAVRNLQDKLTKIKDKKGQPYLPRIEVDGVFGKVTQTAIKRLQADNGLDADGLVGPNTRELIEMLLP